MSDTQRTRAQLLSLFADNVTGQISEQDLRDMLVTIMESEFSNPGDFWATPQAKYTVTDKTGRGDKIYSQYVGSACSFGNAMFQEASTGYWMRADVANSTMTGRIAAAMDSYVSDFSTATMMYKGVIYDSSLSTVFSELIGRPVYLDSGVPGSISVGITANSVLVLGWILGSGASGESAIGKYYFNPDWAIKGQ